MIWHGAWQAVIRAHEEELMRQIPGRPVPLGEGEIPPQFGGHQPLTPAEAIARSAPRSELEEAIRAYARKLLAQRAAYERDQRIAERVRELIVHCGGTI